LGILARIASITAALMPLRSGVSVAPGATQFALTLRVPISSESARVKPMMAAFAAQ
jgi:hypothetical protein